MSFADPPAVVVLIFRRRRRPVFELIDSKMEPHSVCPSTVLQREERKYATTETPTATKPKTQTRQQNNGNKSERSLY